MLEAAREGRFSVYHSKGRLLVLPTKFEKLELFSKCQALLKLVFVSGTDAKRNYCLSLSRLYVIWLKVNWSNII
jgi:hypothetical protein